MNLGTGPGTSTNRITVFGSFFGFSSSSEVVATVGGSTATVDIAGDDTLEALTERIHLVEHRLLVETLADLCAQIAADRPTPDRPTPDQPIPDRSGPDPTSKGAAP